MVDADRDLKFEACVAKARSDVARIINIFFIFILVVGQEF